MPEPLPVHVSRSERHAIETVESFESAGPFVVEVTNHGGDAHVHLRLDEALAGAARIEGDGNVYVENGETRRVRVETAPGTGPVTGTLTVETGYGAEGVGIDVHLADPSEAGDGPETSVGTTVEAEISEADANSSADEESAASTGGGLGTPTVPAGILPVAALAVVALGIAVLTALALESPVVVAGVAVVLVAIVVAAALLIR